jgi:prepilin-type N-terminal cleavage/methylation domain-containing protein
MFRNSASTAGIDYDAQRTESMVKNPAFTLIELLVVIAIIAILASLLLLALVGANLRPYRVVYLSNLRQLNLNATMYWQDFGEGQPVAFRDATGYPLWWRYQGASKTGLPDIRICPVAKEPQPASYMPGSGERLGRNPGTAGHCWRIPGTPLDPPYDWTGSYAFNRWLYLENPNSTRYPTSTPLFVDAIWEVVQPQPNEGGARDLFSGVPVTGSSLGFAIGCVTIARHGSKSPKSAPRDWPRNQQLPRAWGVNVSFADSHAELVKLADLWTLTWNRTWESPSPLPPWRP